MDVDRLRAEAGQHAEQEDHRRGDGQDDGDGDHQRQWHGYHLPGALLAPQQLISQQEDRRGESQAEHDDQPDLDRVFDGGFRAQADAHGEAVEQAPNH